ncbi:MAG: lipopolysaccharide export LptBFGC system permease protein LptF [Flavobacteriaceae bacterium]|jgi:lipopolysaccharide export LptBFGC system permease protein LptF|tara:strand:- start:17638 stop:17796 length:159 start_codon:yes stop_codon:yes gene_type:complete
MEIEQINPFALILTLTGFIFYIVGWIQPKYPPKNTNYLYGYRTNNSMQNQQN